MLIANTVTRARTHTHTHTHTHTSIVHTNSNVFIYTVFTLYNRFYNRLYEHSRLYNLLGELCK